MKEGVGGIGEEVVAKCENLHDEPNRHSPVSAQSWQNEEDDLPANLTADLGLAWRCSGLRRELGRAEERLRGGDEESERERARFRLEERPRRWRGAGCSYECLKDSAKLGHSSARCWRPQLPQLSAAASGAGRRWCAITHCSSTAMPAGSAPLRRKETPRSNTSERQALSKIMKPWLETTMARRSMIGMKARSSGRKPGQHNL